ncbi:MAG: Serine/threonine-protein kinase PknD [Mycoplasmataceae bacterium]|nr:Serine/threonine-protein kinase PknD [Mycoplasmataceae bacterium]WNE40669.1 MAG: Serine/threonine-protein kinase PknD [Mycoplasmataceae bacterium]
MALKFFTKKNIDKKFLLQELINHKALSASAPICYGVTQNPRGDYALVMHYCEHGIIREYLKNNEINWHERIIYSMEVASGLWNIHDQDIIHSDFHLGNILLTKRGSESKPKIVITDFGLSRFFDDHRENKTIFGVLPYVAPEVLQGRSYTQSSDIYSLAMVIYEILTGLEPYHGYI